MGDQHNKDKKKIIKKGSPSLHFVHCLTPRLNTDILFGRRHGLRTLLVLTGDAQRDHLLSVSQEEEPEFFCDSIASLLTCKF